MKQSPLDTALNRLRLWQKFAVLALFGVILVAAPFILYVLESGKTIDATRLELRGLQPMHQMMKTLQLTQQHRGLSMMTLNGDASADARRASLQTEIDHAFETLDADLRRDVHDPAVLGVWQETQQAWKALAEPVSRKSIKPADSFQAHVGLITQLLRTKSLLLQYYGLSFDPQAQGYYLIDTALNQVPMLTEMFGQARAIGSGLLTSREASDAERLRITVLINRAEEHYISLNDALESAARQFPELGARLAEPGRTALQEARQAIELAQKEILQTQTLQFPAADFFTHYTRTIDAQYALDQVALGQLESVLNERADALSRTRLLLSGGIVLLSLLAALANYLITRALLRQLGGEPAYATALLNRIATGDLAVPIELKPQDRVSLLFALRDMRDHLSDIVSQVRNGADSIASASSQITAGNLDLSSRTEQQASSLAETAATMEQITATVRQNADNAQQANSLAESAGRTATEGGAIVAELVTTMSEIDSRGQQVADIIGVIDSIAFQTNILALNAAVEAARAGEQGRGFAVVASEVRALAQRSAGAAKEIKTLIDTSVESTTRGSEQAARAGATMQEIVEGIHRVTDIMGEISAASREQTTGIEEINAAVTQMDDATRQNASLVEESAAAATSLQEQADTLVDLVAFFHLNPQDPADIRPPAAAPRALNAPVRQPRLLATRT
ncbi:MAG: methyl-accepting chemotaxis protein [Castellaniella sp.]|uniref:Methyl-accepting chemotaxis protein n=1 Tax=Castellaniella hirudinis TaxID=1144617 RepID=A0ABV8RYM9_9BURK